MKTAAVSALFLASLTFVPELQAGPVVTARGDLILGFKATDPPGLDTNLEVNLGPASVFYTAAAGSVTELTRLSLQDLKDTYGNDWATRADLTWGVVGTTGASAVGTAVARTLWATRAEDTAGTASEPWQTGLTTQQQIPSNAILALYSGSPGSLGNTNLNATANSIYSAKVLTSLAGCWTERETSLAGVSFQYFNPGVMKSVKTLPSAPGSVYDGTAYSVLDLYQLTPGTIGPATRLGGLGLNAAGKLVFSTDITKFAQPSTNVELGQPTLTYSGTGSATVVLTNAPAGTYVLERSTALATGTWATILTPQTPVAGTLTYVDPSPPAGRGFYRIKKTS